MDCPPLWLVSLGRKSSEVLISHYELVVRSIRDGGDSTMYYSRGSKILEG